MTAYEKIAAEACQWCAKGLSLSGGIHICPICENGAHRGEPTILPPPDCAMCGRFTPNRTCTACNDYIPNEHTCIICYRHGPINPPSLHELIPCTAPTKDAVIERLSAERDRALSVNANEAVQWKKMVLGLQAECDQLKAERDKLREALEKAPHTIGCWGGTIAAGGTDESPNRHKCIPKCWKAALAAPAQETKERNKDAAARF